MRTSAEKIISKYDGQMNAYEVLLNVRYYNICPKADALSLLSVTITIDGTPHNIEDVAQAAEYEWNQLLVLPYDYRHLSDILAGILKAHPDFLPALHSADGTNDKESQAILLTMQKVDGDRRDLLNKIVDGLYEQYAAILKTKYDEGGAELTALYTQAQFTKEQRDEANLRYDQTYNKYVQDIKDIHQTKLQDIEYAYQQYLLEEQENAPLSPSEAEDFDAAMTMEI